jgi:DNA-binding LytR/AlgR family response regulator
MKINCIAIDDEPLALDKMKNYIGKINFLNLLTTFDNGIDAINFLKNNTVHLMFLDIQMDDFSGIQLLESIQNKPKVILTTAYASYALKGYELDVLDYLLKPISFERFVKAIDKVFDSLKEKNEPQRLNTQQPQIEETKIDFMFIKTDSRMQKLIFDDILYIEGMKDYLYIKTRTDKIIILQSFKNMEKLLPTVNFLRVHKSYIVAIDKIESIERNRIKISDKNIPIGDTYKKYFFDCLQKRNLM